MWAGRVPDEVKRFFFAIQIRRTCWSQRKDQPQRIIARMERLYHRGGGAIMRENTEWNSLIKSLEISHENLSCDSTADLAYFLASTTGNDSASIFRPEMKSRSRLLISCLDKSLLSWRSLSELKIHRLVRAVTQSWQLVSSCRLDPIVQDFAKRTQQYSMCAIKFMLEDFASSLASEEMTKKIFKSSAVELTTVKRQSELDHLSILFVLHAFGRTRFRHDGFLRFALKQLPAAMHELPLDLHCLALRSLNNLRCKIPADLLNFLETNTVSALTSPIRASSSSTGHDVLVLDFIPHRMDELIKKGNIVNPSRKAIARRRIVSLVWLAKGLLDNSRMASLPTILTAISSVIAKRNGSFNNEADAADVADVLVLFKEESQQNNPPPSYFALRGHWLQIITSSSSSYSFSSISRILLAIAKLYDDDELGNELKRNAVVILLHRLFYIFPPRDARRLHTLLCALKLIDWKTLETTQTAEVIPHFSANTSSTTRPLTLQIVKTIYTTHHQLSFRHLTYLMTLLCDPAIDAFEFKLADNLAPIMEVLLYRVAEKLRNKETDDDPRGTRLLRALQAWRIRDDTFISKLPPDLAEFCIAAFK